MTGPIAKPNLRSTNSRRIGRSAVVWAMGLCCWSIALVGCNDSQAQIGAEPSPPTAVSLAPMQDAPAAGEVTASGPAEEQPKEASGSSDRLVSKTFDDIKFDIEPDAPFDRSMLTEPIEALNGQRISIRGYILPTARRTGIKQFVLVRDNQECCFGPGAALYDCILVEMEPGKSTEFSVKPVAVEGTFSIEEFPGPSGRPLAIYRLLGEAVLR